MGKLTSETFTGNGSWVAPAGVTSVIVRMWGAGPGGEQGEYSTLSAGSAAERVFFLDVVPNTSYTITIGAGGAGGTGGYSGYTGGYTYFGSIAVAVGTTGTYEAISNGKWSGFVGGTIANITEGPRASPFGYAAFGGDYGGTGGAGGRSGPGGNGGQGGNGINHATTPADDGAAADANSGAGGGSGGVNPGAGANGTGGAGGAGKCTVIWVE